MKKILPIGNDDFREIREEDFYYVDKTLMIRDFIEMHDKVTLLARPRRFGKTLNMTMIREFFDITKDSREIFKDLAIMHTEYASKINSCPVVFLTFKDCKGTSEEELFEALKGELYREYIRHEEAVRNKLADGYEKEDFYRMVETLRTPGEKGFVRSLFLLTQTVKKTYGIAPILLIDEYDQPIMSSYESGYREQLGSFFTNFYGSGMKSNDALSQALLTGVQRIAQESIFSHFNNPVVYTVLDEEYAPYFGLTVTETQRLLEDYDLELNKDVQKKYNGYRFGGIQMYNPWSILCYARKSVLRNYWTKTSANTLVKHALQSAKKNSGKNSIN